MLSEQEKKRRLALLQQQTRPLSPVQQIQSTFQQLNVPQPVQPQIKVGPTTVTVKQPTTTPTVQMPTTQMPTTQPKLATRPLSPMERIVQQAPKPVPMPVVIRPTEKPAQQGISAPIQETVNKSFQNLQSASKQLQSGQLSQYQFNQIANQYNLGVEQAKKAQAGIDLANKELPNLINEYNKLNDKGQRDIRDKLTNIYNSYNSARTPELRNAADKAAGYLSVLTSSKTDIVKAAPPEAKAYYESLPEVKPKQSFMGTIQDIAGSLVQGSLLPFEQVGTAARALTGTNEFAKNEADLAAGRITQEEFDRRQSEINARIARTTGTMTGENKGLADQLLRAAGITAGVALPFLPGAGIVRGVTAAPGQLARTVASQAALGAGVSGLSVYGRTGIETQPTEVIASALIGGIVQGSVPALSSLTARTITRIKAKPINELTDAERQLLAREGEVHPQAATTPKPAEVPTPTAAPIARTSAQVVPDTAITNIVNAKKIADIENAVKAVYPDGTPSVLNTAISEIQKAQNPVEVRTILDSLAEAKAAVQAVTPEGIPTQAVAREQAFAAETQRPTGAVAAPKAPEAPIAPTTVPEGVQGAQAPTTVPGAAKATALPADVIGTIGGNTIEANVAATEAVKEGQKIKLGTRILDTLKRELLDPQYYNQRLVNQIAKKRGIKLDQVPLADDLVYLQRQINTATDRNTVLMNTPTITGDRFIDVMNRWAPQNEGKNFIEWMNQRFALEIYDKSGGKIWKVRGFKPEEVRASVEAYAQANPQAVKDAATIKAWADSLIDEGVAAGEITKEFGDMIKNTYQNYVPLTAVHPEDVVRPQIRGGLGSVGQQNVVRFLTEGTGVYDNTFNALMTRGQQVIQKARVNQYNEALYRLSKNGEIPGLKLVVDPEKTKAQAAILAQLVPLRETLAIARRSRGKLAAGKRAAKAELVTAQTQAAETARQYLITQATDNKSLSFARRLSQKELLDVFDLLVDTDAANVTRIANKLRRKGTQYDNVVDQLEEARTVVEQLTGAASDLTTASRALSQVPPTNVNKIAGFTGGDKFVLEITDPRLTKQLEYIKSINELNNKEVQSRLRRAMDIAATGQKILYTGPFAPQFLIKSAIRQQALKYTNVPGLSAFGARPATVGYLSGLTRKGQIYENMINAGFTPPKATKVSYADKRTVKQMAAYANRLDRLKYTVKTPREWWNMINTFAASTDIADRVQVGYAQYLRAKNRNPNISEADAWASAANAANTWLGDFRRVSKLARDAEPIVPYSGATQAGYRALMRAFRVRPVETTLKVASLTAPLVALTAYQADKYKEYYDDLIKDNNTNDLDTNLIILNPLSHKDPATGDWVNITKIPLAPDFKALNRAAWRTGYSIANGQVPDLGIFAEGIGDFITAGQRESLWGDPKYTSGLGQVVPQSPVKNLLMIGFGLNPNSGRPLANDTIARKAREFQFTDYTSESAKNISKALQGFLTPQQIDELANKGGILGDLLQARGGLIEAGSAPFRRIFSETNARSDKQKVGSTYYKAVEEAKKNILKDDKQLKAFELIQQNHTNDFGQPTENGMLDSAVTAMSMLANPQVIDAMLYINKQTLAAGGNPNPLYDETLTPEQRKKVLTYRSMKVNNAAKQNYTKNGESAFVSLGLDEKWYSDFKQKEDAYWKRIEDQKNAGKDVNTETQQTIKTFSGSARPTASPELQQKIDYYYTLPKGAGGRSAFLKANPDIIDYWNQQNDFTNEERIALGFKPIVQNQIAASRFNYSSGARVANWDRYQKQYLTQLLSAVQPVGLPEAPKLKPVPKIKTKKPSTPRRTKRIKLQ